MVYDFAILGGGCSGLTMAVELINVLPDGQRIVIIEPRKKYRMDRIWCFWDTMPHRFGSSVSHQWYRWKVRNDGREMVHSTARFPYHYLAADDFYAAALNAIEKYPWAELRLGTLATDVVEEPGVVRVKTDQGVVQALRVLDARNQPGSHVGNGRLLQHYAGHRIHTMHPVFDPSTLTLMDFDVSQENGIAFFYVLPFSETEALVEPTVFSHRPLHSDAYSRWIRNYMLHRYGVQQYDILFKEQGVIPMATDVSPPTKPSRIIPIGTAAGMVKGSTGYGFLAIQKSCRELAKQLAVKQVGAVSLPRSAMSIYLDRIFLSFLEAHPKNAPAVFFDLFDGVAPDRLVRFLSDRPTPLDIATVVTTMPKRPFLREAFHVMTATGAHR